MRCVRLRVCCQSRLLLQDLADKRIFDTLLPTVMFFMTMMDFAASLSGPRYASAVDIIGIKMAGDDSQINGSPKIQHSNLFFF